MGNIDRMRGRRGDGDFDMRVERVLRGDHDPSPTVISAAANHLLSPFLKAKTAEAKGGILSMRQIQRRRNREIPIGTHEIGYFKGKATVEGDCTDEA